MGERVLVIDSAGYSLAGLAGNFRKNERMKATLGLLQHSCGAAPAANLQKALDMAEKAAKRGAQIICTQELFRSQYFCQAEDHKYFALAETIPGPTTVAFQEFARRRRVVVIASLFERRASGLYHNSAAIIDAKVEASRIVRRSQRSER